MFRVFFRRCPVTLYGVEANVASRNFLSVSDATPNVSRIYKLVLLGSGTPD